MLNDLQLLFDVQVAAKRDLDRLPLLERAVLVGLPRDLGLSSEPPTMKNNTTVL